MLYKTLYLSFWLLFFVDTIFG